MILLELELQGAARNTETIDLENKNNMPIKFNITLIRILGSWTRSMFYNILGKNISSYIFVDRIYLKVLGLILDIVECHEINTNVT